MSHQDLLSVVGFITPWPYAEFTRHRETSISINAFLLVDVAVLTTVELIVIALSIALHYTAGFTKVDRSPLSCFLLPKNIVLGIFFWFITYEIVFVSLFLQLSVLAPSI